jgi:hypothetical protein
VAKTYLLQAVDPPLAQGIFWSTTPGGRVDVEENGLSTTFKFYWISGIFSSYGIDLVDK